MQKGNSSVIVTGALGGIGSEIVNYFELLEWNVIPIDIMSSKNQLPGSLLHCDLRHYANSSTYRDEKTRIIKGMLPERLERLVIVNNAATQKIRLVTELTFEDWDETYSVNVMAPYFLCRAFYDELRACNGRIINISSIHASLTKAGFAAYAASKAALNSLTKSLAIEWSSDGIAVNAVAPAAIDTPMLREGFEDNGSEFDSLKSFHPTKEIGNPSDVANMVGVLAQLENNFLTGSVIDLSGGISGVLHDPK